MGSSQEHEEPSIPIRSEDLIRKLEEMYPRKPFDPLQSHIQTAFSEGQREVVEKLLELLDEDQKLGGGIPLTVLSPLERSN